MFFFSVYLVFRLRGKRGETGRGREGEREVMHTVSSFCSLLCLVYTKKGKRGERERGERGEELIVI